MKKPLLFTIIATAILLSTLLVACVADPLPAITEDPETITILPTPQYEGAVSVEEALLRRRSVRDYTNQPLTLVEVSQLLWAAQGKTESDGGGRTAPSAGGLYPLEIYLLAGKVTDLSAGIYRYIPDQHAVELIVSGDHRLALYESALKQGAVKDGAAVIVIAAIYERTTVKYDQRGIQYVHIEVGTAAQNIYLQAVALDLGTVFIGAFEDDQVQKVLLLSEDEIPFAIMPVGKK